MSRKIVICPSFASAHFIKCHIPNLLDVIEPDVIIYNEGLFPQGPENKGHVDTNEFREKWLYGGGNVGFDFEETTAIWIEMTWKHPDTKLRIHNIFYPSDSSADECYRRCMSTFHGFTPEPGDWIFPLEPDAFHHENDKVKIQKAIEELQPGEGLQTKWVDFLETQYYTEAINLEQPKWRRFCYRFDNMENYLLAIDGFVSQRYLKLKKTEEFITYHYPWFNPGKYRDLRFELIYRSNPQYWEDFQKGLDEIRKMSELHNRYENIRRSEPDTLVDKRISNQVVIRPSRRNAGRYAQFIDIDHPAAIKKHPNFVK